MTEPHWQSLPTGHLPPPSAMPPGWYPDPLAAPVLRWWDGRMWTGLLYAMPTQPRESDLVPVLGWLCGVTGLIIAIGSFMNWATALGGLVSVSGTDGGPGYVTLLLGTSIGLLGLLTGLRVSDGRPLLIANFIASVSAVAFAIYEMHDVHSQQLAIGGGLWLIALAAVTGAVLALIGSIAG
jgi:hypothetical protein